MRKLLLTLPLAALPLAVIAQNADETLPTLAKHVHGEATVNIVIDNNKLELELDSPAINIVGFEHEATTADEKAEISKATKTLEDPILLFGITKNAKCTLDNTEIEIPLLGHDHPHDEDSDHDHDHEHSDVEAEYTFTCTNSKQLTSLDFKQFFTSFPKTEKINVQLIAPQGQNAFELTPTKANFSW